jgi:Translin family
MPQCPTTPMHGFNNYGFQNTKISIVSQACLETRQKFEVGRAGYEKLKKLVPAGQYYRYNDHWHFTTQRFVFLIAMTIYLEKNFLVTRETAAEILGCRFPVIFIWFTSNF